MAAPIKYSTEPLATAPVTPEVTEAAPTPAPEKVVTRFVTTVSDLNPEAPAPVVRKLSPKTIQEHKAGREAISQYQPAAE